MEEYLAQRKQMVKDVLGHLEPISQTVLQALLDVPRHEFVPLEWRQEAYADGALPLAHGQTISQPFMVAKVAELAQLGPSDRVLEVGAGCGYQAAILSRLCGSVIGIEWYGDLVQSARDNLKRAGVTGVKLVQGDGKRGYPSAAPFDAIVVSCAAPEVPKAWQEQLKSGGRLVFPHARGSEQVLERWFRGDAGWEKKEQYFGVRYVPLQ